MSLWVYLEAKANRCEHCGRGDTKDEVFEANITHNLTRMADEAGIYKAVWHPSEAGITQAKDLINPLQSGLALMRKDPARFKALDAKNGWGTYQDFVPWLERYLEACEQNPGAYVRASG